MGLWAREKVNPTSKIMGTASDSGEQAQEK